ncbi:MAG: hypothetical protein QOF48_1542 [Verrucomicrobiota bacterium]|jgi:hypothetical protein
MRTNIFGEPKNHAPLRGAGMRGFVIRWVRPLARASHRLPSSVPLGHCNRLPSFVPSGQGLRTTVLIAGLLAGLPFLAAAESITNPPSWSFRNDVQPVLAKAGCSSGACHGAAAGQGGFKLSLRGYDDDGDWRAITRGAFGRRLVPSDPGRSLLLTKPTAAVAHKGGLRFEIGSSDYRILSEWIAAGTPPPRDDDPRIQKLDIFPPHSTLQPGAAQQLTVRAHFSDGTERDVTRWVKFTDANASVTQVDDVGGVKVMGFGEGAITAWYLSKIAIASITVPHTNILASGVFAGAPRRNFIDDLVLEKLRELNLPPSPRCTDGEFIRRAFLDTLGVLPTAQEVREFLAHTASERADAKKHPADAGRHEGIPARDQLIESLLGRPEFVDYWAYKWSDLLLVSSDKLKPAAMWSYYQWIRNNVAANTPWDRFAREVVTAQGSTLENGAANFFALHDDPPSLAETTIQAFLGMSINCAKCHNHPMEKWTNDEYWGFANLFARARTKAGAFDGEKVVFAAAEGDINQPLRGRPQPPRPLDGHPLRIDDPRDRREALTEWLTSRDNPYFSRAIANRVWANFMGVGLIEKVDDLRVTNPASHEKLLGATAKFLADKKFDLKALMQAILQSETYQRSSEARSGNAADTRFYSRYYPRRLSAEVLLDAYSQVTGVPTEFRTDLRNQNRGFGEKYPAGLRALQLPDTRIFSYFLKTFGRPDREKTCECERAGEPTMAQALHLANGDTLNQKLASKESVVARYAGTDMPTETLIEEAYLAALARLPTSAERKKVAAILKAAPKTERRVAIEDAYWALLSSKEFIFNH